MSDRQTPETALVIAQSLLRCPSVTPADGGALDYLHELLKVRGFTCYRLRFHDRDTPDIDNLYARIGTKAPHLCFAGHTDVVPTGDEAAWTVAPFSGEVHDGLLYGRGAADMKGGIAAFVAATLAYLDELDGDPPGSISFLITGDEEGPAINGTAKMLQWAAEHGETFDHCIVGEPTNPNALGDMIKIGRRGSLSGTITVTGRQGHVAYPHLACNPIPGLARLIGHLSAQTLDEGSEHFQPSSLEFVSIDVGNPAWNMIPREARARFNVRFNDLWNTATLTTHLRARLDEAAGNEVRYRLDLEDVVSDVFITQNSELIDVLGGAIRSVTGRVPDLSTSGGTSDARFIKNYCPVIEFGLVGQTMHQVDEHISLADLAALTDIYRHTLGAYFARFGEAPDT